MNPDLARTVCPLCLEDLDMPGTLSFFPTHFRSPERGIRCEASGYARWEVARIIADRKEQASPGRYARPHP